jgi:Ca-activated chloride channel family protein
MDYRALDQIVADLSIGDVPEMGTAIGDALALSLASLRRSEAKSKVVILLSDGDSNWTTKFDPVEAKELAKKMNVKVFTILLGRERRRNPFGFRSRYNVNPQLLKEIAQETGGLYFRAGDDEALESSFAAVRKDLDKTRIRVTGRVPGAELFYFFLIPAIGLILLEILLGLTRWRRFP